jgi:hypothetical protein
MDLLLVMMDPNKDNAYLTISEFVSIGKDWLLKVKQSQTDDPDNSGLAERQR